MIGVNHYGGIRAALPKGEYHPTACRQHLAFGSAIVAYRFDGKRLKKLLEDGRKNPNGFLQSSDLTLTLSGNKIEKIVYTRDGQKTEIEDNTPCVVTLDAFITDGGDGYDASLFKGYEIPEFDNLGIISTDAFMDYLKGNQETHHGRIHAYARYFKVKPYLCGRKRKKLAIHEQHIFILFIIAAYFTVLLLIAWSRGV